MTKKIINLYVNDLIRRSFVAPPSPKGEGFYRLPLEGKLSA